MRFSIKIMTVLAALVLSAGQVSFAQEHEHSENCSHGAPAATELKSYDGFNDVFEMASYIIGTSFGQQLKSQFDTADVEKVLAGVKDAFAEGELAIPESDVEQIMMTFQSKMMAKQTGQEAPETEPLKDYPGFTNDDQKVSYVIGTIFASQMQGQPFEVVVDKLVKGFSDAHAGSELAIPEEDYQNIMTAFRTKVMEKIEKERTERLAAAGWKTKLKKPDMMEFDSAKNYFWVLETNKGNIKLQLWPDIAPMHVSSTIFLTNKKFYDDITFHRVIPGFMAQGGCPLGDGTGSPGYEYDGEYKDDVKFDKPFLLAMANAGPGTDGSQFFITFGEPSHLNGKHTIFGEVVEGKEVVGKLEKLGSQSGATKEELKIVKATIVEEAK